MGDDNRTAVSDEEVEAALFSIIDMRRAHDERAERGITDPDVDKLYDVIDLLARATRRDVPGGREAEAREVLELVQRGQWEHRCSTDVLTAGGCTAVPTSVLVRVDAFLNPDTPPDELGPETTVSELVASHPLERADSERDA